MKCQELLALLGEYVDGDLDPSLCQELERHMEGCDPCQIVIDTLEQTVTLYRGEQECELPADFRGRLHESLRERWQERRG